MNGRESVNVAPLTLTLSPMGGEGIKKEPFNAPLPGLSSLSSRRGKRAGVRGAAIILSCSGTVAQASQPVQAQA